MTKKIGAIAFSILLIGLSGCDKVVKETILPKYQLSIGDRWVYKTELEADISMNIAFFKYEGKVRFTSDFEFRVADTNNNGYRMELDIKNPNVEGGDARIRTAIFIALNNIRNWFSSFYMTEYGKITVFFENRTYPEMASYAAMFLPDFSTLDKVYLRNEWKTNFPTEIEKKPIIIEIKHTTKINDAMESNISMDNSVILSLFEKDDYERSVEPRAVGVFTADMKDGFHIQRGRLTEKTGKLNLELNLSITQGILTFLISAKGKGSLNMTLLGD